MAVNAYLTIKDVEEPSTGKEKAVVVDMCALCILTRPAASSLLCFFLLGILMAGVPFTLQGQTDSEIVKLREIINRNDALMTPPTGWHFKRFDNGERGAEPDDQQAARAGLALVLNSFYQQRDPVAQLDPRFGAGVARAFGLKYQGVNCSRAARIPDLKGYLYVACSARDVTDDSAHSVWFAANGFTLERVWFVAPNQTLLNQYMGNITKWVDMWFRRRAMTASEQQRLASILSLKPQCWSGCQDD